MAYTQLASIAWGSGPEIPTTISYDKQRSGADMQYKIKVTMGPLTGSSYFGFPINLGIKLDNVSKVSGYALKAASPSQWSSAITYESGWLTVPGKTSGSTSLAVNIYSGGGSSRNYTYTYSLPVDPGASTVSVADGMLGVSKTISITRLDSTFTHTLHWRVSGGSWQQIATGVGTAYLWTPGIELAQYNTTGDTVVVEIRCQTYKSGALIGTTFDSCKLAIPSSVKPTVSITTTDPDGYRTTYGSYIQSKSRLQVNLTSAGVYGSTITSRSIKISQGTTQYWSYSAASATTPPLTKTGTYTVTATVTDSRGRTETATANITVAAYAEPTVTSLSVTRSNSGGTAQPDGTHCKVTFSAQITPLSSQNTATYKVCYREKGASTWYEAAVTAATGNYSPSNITYIFVANQEKAYEVRIKATDAFSTGTSATTTLGIAFVLMQFTDDMTGIAFGQRATQPGKFAVGMPLIFTVGGQTLAFPDDFASGTWNPQLYRGEDLLIPITETGLWAKTGNVATIFIEVVCGDLPAGNLRIRDIPPEIRPSSGRYISGMLAIDAGSPNKMLIGGSFGTQGRIFLQKNGGGYLKGEDVASGDRITLSGSYIL